MSNTLNLCIAHAFVSNCLFNKIFNQPSFLPSWVSRNISPYLCVLMLCTLCEIIVVSYGVLLLLVAGCFSFCLSCSPLLLAMSFYCRANSRLKLAVHEPVDIPQTKWNFWSCTRIVRSHMAATVCTHLQQHVVSIPYSSPIIPLLFAGPLPV